MWPPHSCCSVRRGRLSIRPPWRQLGALRTSLAEPGALHCRSHAWRHHAPARFFPCWRATRRASRSALDFTVDSSMLWVAQFWRSLRQSFWRTSCISNGEHTVPSSPAADLGNTNRRLRISRSPIAASFGCCRVSACCSRLFCRCKPHERVSTRRVLLLNVPSPTENSSTSRDFYKNPCEVR